jgi:hypothetical protein
LYILCRYDRTNSLKMRTPGATYDGVFLEIPAILGVLVAIPHIRRRPPGVGFYLRQGRDVSQGMTDRISEVPDAFPRNIKSFSLCGKNLAIARAPALPDLPVRDP